MIEISSSQVSPGGGKLSMKPNLVGMCPPAAPLVFLPQGFCVLGLGRKSSCRRLEHEGTETEAEPSLGGWQTAYVLL